VPENEPLLAEVMVKNDAIGFIFPQQKVKVKITAYPFEKYGMLDGKVIYIGPDASGRAGRQSAAKGSSKSAPPPGSPYKVLIALQKQVLEAQGKKFKLVPGMQVIAEINEGRRTVMEYLLSPVEKTLDDSGHER
ncbi:MAG TPA: HlyD family type I secretion periplasmic adaptor subunit, partial [Betaproteobacteria bacterium]|nr:HlyD family type I secretion periplasmic adaptor subunit [Betaproteobacteria bacterium]